MASNTQYINIIIIVLSMLKWDGTVRQILFCLLAQAAAAGHIVHCNSQLQALLNIYLTVEVRVQNKQLD